MSIISQQLSNSATQQLSNSATQQLSNSATQQLSNSATLGEPSESDIISLLGDKDFLHLKKQFQTFNPFSVLKLENQEIRHSNVLAWLLNPTESHGLGKAFLEQFLLALPDAVYDDFDGDIETAQKAAADFSLYGGWNVKVRRETESKESSKGKRRVDLEIICENSAAGKKSAIGNFIILIENKIYSTQEKTQLKDYREHLESKIKKKNLQFKIFPVYLTLNEDDEPNDENYFHFTYRMIYEILGNLTDNSQNQRTENFDDAKRFIQFYKKILEERMDVDCEKARLAREIYKNNREIIDYINKCTENILPVSVAGETFISEYNTAAKIKLEKLAANSRSYFFIDSVLKNTSGGVEKDWRGGAICGYFFSLWETSDDENSGKIQLNIEVGPFADNAKRSEFLNLLKEKRFKFKSPKKENSKYTKISYGKKLVDKIDDSTDADEIAQKMAELFNAANSAVEKLHECVKEFK